MKPKQYLSAILLAMLLPILTGCSEKEPAAVPTAMIAFEYSDNGFIADNYTVYIFDAWGYYFGQLAEESVGDALSGICPMTDLPEGAYNFLAFVNLEEDHILITGNETLEYSHYEDFTLQSGSESTFLVGFAKRRISLSDMGTIITISMEDMDFNGNGFFSVNDWVRRGQEVEL